MVADDVLKAIIMILEGHSELIDPETTIQDIEDVIEKWEGFYADSKTRFSPEAPSV